MVDQPCKDAFEELKRRLTTSPIMQPPDWELPFELMCDAYNYALGVVLLQRVDRLSLVIAYASCTLDAAQVNYTTVKKELLTIVLTIFFIDHATLRYMLKKPDAKPRLIR